MQLSLQSLGPLVALIGTIAVALLGFYQWRRQYANANRAANAAARREAYEGLWQKLEQINLDLREGNDCNPRIYERLREVNVYFFSHSLYFDDGDQSLINDYIAAMGVLREKIYASDDSDVTSAFSRTWVGIPPTLDAEIRVAAAQVERLRGKIKKKIQRVAASN